MVPPWAVTYAARASVIEREPPRATAQPHVWQAQMSAVPTDELIGRVSGAIACAATPPKSALAWGVRQRLASTVAGEAATSPNRIRLRGWRGRWSTGRIRSSLSASNDFAGRPKTPRQRGPSSPRASSVASSERIITPALPSSSGWARSTSGQRHSSP